MNNPAVRTAEGTGTYRRWFIASLAIGVVPLAAAMTFLYRLNSGPDAGLTIDPPRATIGDGPIKEAELIEGKFRIVNPLGRAVTVREIVTSCSCAATAVDDGLKPPFVVQPGRSVHFTLKTITRAQPQAE